jgi:hypothetical protein
VNANTVELLFVGVVLLFVLGVLGLVAWLIGRARPDDDVEVEQ